MQVTGSSIIVRTDGGVKMFTQSDIDKRGVKIMRRGEPANISDFRANDRLTATIVTTKPPKVMTEKEVQATLAQSGGGAGTPAAAAAPPSTPPRTAPAPSQAAPAPSQAAPPSQAAATSGAAPKKLPKTASLLPLLGLVGLSSLIAGLGFTARRRSTR